MQQLKKEKGFDSISEMWYNASVIWSKSVLLVELVEVTEMARQKGDNAKKENPPRDPKTVKRGCLSCVSYQLTMNQEPCKSCHDWNNWVDAHPEKSW